MSAAAVVPELGVAPGMALLVLGAPATGKTRLAHTLAADVAEGRPALGAFEVNRPGRVRVVDTAALDVARGIGKPSIRDDVAELAEGCVLVVLELSPRLDLDPACFASKSTEQLLRVLELLEQVSSASGAAFVVDAGAATGAPKRGEPHPRLGPVLRDRGALVTTREADKLGLAVMLPGDVRTYNARIERPFGRYVVGGAS